MPIAQTIPILNGSVVNNGTLCLQKAVGLGSYGKIYHAIDAGSASSSRRSSWASSSSASSSCSSSSKPAVYAVKCLRKLDSFQADPNSYDYERSLHRKVSSHPNVVTLLGDFMEEGHMFFVMEFHASGSMLRAINDGLYQRNSPLIKRVFFQLVDAVLFCHRKGVYHRNIKPAHILVDHWGGNPCLTDFGIATSDTESFELDLGTAPYMTPESFEHGSGGSYRPELSDAWALGMTLMNMVTTQCPWFSARPNVDRSFEIFIQSRPHYLCRKLPLSRPLAALFTRLLRLKPTKRLSLERFNEKLQRIDDLFISARGLEKAVMTVRQQAEWTGTGRKEHPPEGVEPPTPPGLSTEEGHKLATGLAWLRFWR